MLYIHYLRAFALIVTLFMLASMVLPVLADCIATANGSGSDYHCTDTTEVVNGSPGSDNIVNDGTVITYLWGGGFSFNTNQQDTLINNGVVGSAANDDGIWGGAGNDTIINHGVVFGGPLTAWEGVSGAIFGDATEGIADNDTIINNGLVHGNIHGDYSAGGSDTIIINGQVNGGVYGEGHESVQLGRFGDDTVILTNNAVVTTIIDGMGGNDTLRFDFSTPDETTYNALSALISAANPGSGSLTFNDNTFTWVSFEILENSIEWTGQPTPTSTPTATPTATFTATATFTPTATFTLTPTLGPTLITPTSPSDATPARHFSDGEPLVLTWSIVTWAQGYVIEIAQDDNFNLPVIATELPASTQSYTVPVLANGVYYWRVQARQDSSVLGQWGPTESFYISAPATPTPG